MVSRLRLETSESQAKATKDLRQAGELLDILIEQRPYELRERWQEARQRGSKWRQYLDEALDLVDRQTGVPAVRKRLLDLVSGGDGRKA
jgi:hypothetical protein